MVERMQRIQEEKALEKKIEREKIDSTIFKLLKAAEGGALSSWRVIRGRDPLDIHKAIGKLPHPKRGFTLPSHNYTGPYNPLEDQLKFKKSFNNQLGPLTRLSCNMMSTTAAAVFAMRSKTKKVQACC